MTFGNIDQNVCLVCTKTFDSSSLLLDKSPTQPLGHSTVTGWGLCEGHQKLKDDGFIALVGCDESKSELLPNGYVNPLRTHRTGLFYHISEIAWRKITYKLPPLDGVAYCDDNFIHLLKGEKI